MNEQHLINAKNLENAYRNVFSTEDGKKVLDDITRNLLLYGDDIAKNYTSDDALASHIQVGLKLAYKYITSNLPINIIKKSI